MLRLKNIINSCSKFFISNSLCPYYGYHRGKSKALQGRGFVNQIFCLGTVVTIKVSENGLLFKMYHDNDLKLIIEMEARVIVNKLKRLYF